MAEDTNQSPALVARRTAIRAAGLGSPNPERDRRIHAAATHVAAALRRKDARHAAAAIHAMLDEGLTVSDVVDWCDGETSLEEVARLVT